MHGFNVTKSKAIESKSVFVSRHETLELAYNEAVRLYESNRAAPVLWNVEWASDDGDCFSFHRVSYPQQEPIALDVIQKKMFQVKLFHPDDLRANLANKSDEELRGWLEDFPTLDRVDPKELVVSPIISWELASSILLDECLKRGLKK